MNPGEIASLRAVAEAAAQVSAAMLREAALAGGARSVDRKGAVDLVTELDLRSEALIRDQLERQVPGVPVLAEEGGGGAGATTRWIVDPLDGTTNFVHGLPHFAVSIALEHEGRLLVGCVLDVMRGECWSAGAGLGATCSGRPARVSATTTLSDALLATGFPYDRRERAAALLRPVEEMLRLSQGIRRAGAAALDLAWVAGGRLDGFWELGLAPWDVAAGALLVQEAGGRVTQPDGGDLRLDGAAVLASNGRIHEAMASALAPLLQSAFAPRPESKA